MRTTSAHTRPSEEKPALALHCSHVQSSPDQEYTPAAVESRNQRRRGRRLPANPRKYSPKFFVCESSRSEMKKSKSSKSAHPQQRNGHALPFKFSKLLDPEASWDKDQLGDVLHWIRQGVGLVCGLLWGAVPLLGAKWIVVFLMVSSSIIYGYYAHILKIDEEEFGGHGALLQEGLFASFSLFLLAWILVYSLAHF